MCKHNKYGLKKKRSFGLKCNEVHYSLDNVTCVAYSLNFGRAEAQERGRAMLFLVSLLSSYC